MIVGKVFICVSKVCNRVSCIISYIYISKTSQMHKVCRKPVSLLVNCSPSLLLCRRPLNRRIVFSARSTARGIPVVTSAENWFSM